MEQHEGERLTTLDILKFISPFLSVEKTKFKPLLYLEKENLNLCLSYRVYPWSYCAVE